MDRAEKITCPECNTPNAVNAPFCENCGYRLRRPGTVREGHSTISREQALRSRESSGVDTQPERPAVPSRIKEEHTLPESGATILEGLSAVERTESEEELPTVRGHEAIRPESPSFSSGLYSIPVEEHKTNTMMIVGFWAVSMASAVLLTYYLSTREEEPTQLRSENQIVEISQGAFLRGLSEQVRAFMIMTCFRVSEDKDACDEAKLLKGEYPQEKIELSAFKIDSHEVTNRRYQGCEESKACTPIDYRDCRIYTPQGYQVGVRVPKIFQEPHMPVSCVTRSQAAAFCAFENGALPTADQWEKAARGVRGSLFPWGDAWSPNVANWGEVDVIQTLVLGRLDGHEWVAPAASFDEGKSPFGVYDMAGNVAEWVAGEDQVTGEVRGGAWSSLPFDLRTTVRQELSIDMRRADVGFRCVYP